MRPQCEGGCLHKKYLPKKMQVIDIINAKIKEMILFIRQPPLKIDIYYTTSIRYRQIDKRGIICHERYLVVTMKRPLKNQRSIIHIFLRLSLCLFALVFFLFFHKNEFFHREKNYHLNKAGSHRCNKTCNRFISNNIQEPVRTFNL